MCYYDYTGGAQMSAVRDAVLREIGMMNEPDIEEMLSAIRARENPLGQTMSGTEFIKRFGGMIPADELDRMEAAIERDCETIEPSNG